MEKELKEVLLQILANQAIMYHRIEELYQKQIKKTDKAFYTEKRAMEELSEHAQRLMKD